MSDACNCECKRTTAAEMAVNSKDVKIQELEAKLMSAFGIIEFYSDFNSWLNSNEQNDIIIQSDMSAIPAMLFNDEFLCGGKRARNWLKENPEEK